MRILLVEDEPRMANVIAKGLREQSYAVDVAEDGEAGLYQTSINDYDLIVLDVLLPHRDGYEVCRELRTRGDATPILMLTARATVDDRLTGFEAGADDYLTKPFSFRELLARIHALLRRDSKLRPDVLEIEDLIVDSASHRVSRASHNVELTAKEYALLEYLARRAGQARPPPRRGRRQDGPFWSAGYHSSIRALHLPPLMGPNSFLRTHFAIVLLEILRQA